MFVTYNEDQAALTVYSNAKTPPYRYKDVPLSVYNQIQALLRLGVIGKAWQIIKKYEMI